MIGELGLVWCVDELILTGSLNDNDKIDLVEDEDDNLDDGLETLDDVVGGDDVLEDDQDTVGCSASTNLRELCLKHWQDDFQSSEQISCLKYLHKMAAWQFFCCEQD